MVDANTRKTISGIPLLQTKAGPRDKEIWVQRLKEEYQALIQVSIQSSIQHFEFGIQSYRQSIYSMQERMITHITSIIHILLQLVFR